MRLDFEHHLEKGHKERLTTTRLRKLTLGVNAPYMSSINEAPPPTGKLLELLGGEKKSARMKDKCYIKLMEKGLTECHSYCVEIVLRMKERLERAWCSWETDITLFGSSKQSIYPSGAQ